MTFKLPEEVREKYKQAQGEAEARKAVFANLPDEDLAASALFWLHQCKEPPKYTVDMPVYDSTMWHIIVPELIRRLR